MKRSVRLMAYGGLYRFLAWAMSRSGLLNKLARPTANRADRFFRRSYRSAFSFPNPIRFEGHEFFWERESNTVQGMFFGTYEKASVRLFQSIVQPGMNIIDVGGHIGCYSIVAADAVGRNGQVYAFEPHPRTACLLARNVAFNGFEERVTIVRLAVGDTEGRGGFFSDDEDDGSSRLVSGDDHCDSLSSVEITTLDSYFRGAGWPRIDVIKMDIEGSETAALAGMTELSRRNLGLKLIIEFNPDAMGAAGVSVGEFSQALAECGFTSISLIQNQLRGVNFSSDVPFLNRMAQLGSVNLLCVKDGVK